MGILDDFKGKDFERIGDGTYPARIVNVIDLGEQENTFEGETKIQDKVWIEFELPTETITIDGTDKPRWLGKEFTKSTNKNALLMKVLNALYTPKELEEVESFKDLVGKALLIEIGETAGGKDKWIGSSKLMKGMTVPELVNTPKYFDLENPDQEVFDSLPNFLQDKIGLTKSDKVPF